MKAWGEPTFRVRNKMFAMYAARDNHHGRGRPAAWIKARQVDQDLLVSSAPDTYFVPPYVGPSGWIGMWLNRDVQWDLVTERLRNAYTLVAPKKLRVLLEAAEPPA